MIDILNAVAAEMEKRANDCIWSEERETFQDAADALRDAVDLIRHG